MILGQYANLGGFHGITGSTMRVGDHLSLGESITSPSGSVIFTLQPDGNLVVSDWAGKVLWASNTNGKGGGYLIMQDDGNLVLYRQGTTSGASNAVWSTNTWGKGGVAFDVQDSGNIVVYDSGWNPLWYVINDGKVTPRYGPPSDPGRLHLGERLDRGWALWSPSGNLRLELQHSGDLQLIENASGTVVWNSNTANRGGTLVLQRDGNLVIYQPGPPSGVENAVWATQTYGRNVAYLELQDYGNVVLYTESREPIWSTNTADKVITYTPWGTAASKKYPNVPAPATPPDEWYAQNTPEDIMHHLVEIYSNVSYFQIPARELDILKKWAVAVHENQLFGETILIPWGDSFSPDWSAPAGVWLIRRDDENYNKDLNALKKFSSDATGDKTLAMRPFVATQGKDWGTFGIEGFHLENLIGKIGTVAGIILSAIPGVGPQVGSQVAAASQQVQKVIGTTDNDPSRSDPNSVLDLQRAITDAGGVGVTDLTSGTQPDILGMFKSNPVLLLGVGAVLLLALRK